jgi:hypothetical protein
MERIMNFFGMDFRNFANGFSIFGNAICLYLQCIFKIENPFAKLRLLILFL